MIFLDIAYRILAEPRSGADPNLEISARNGLLAHFLDQCYASNQVLAIRRLMDKRSDVVSLRRLLMDIQAHRELITREIYVCYDGLPFDPESWKSLPQTPEIQIWGIEAPGLGKYLGSRHRHETFDQLSGVPASTRQRDDLIKDSVFDRLEGWLDSSPAPKIIELSHKFFAHAADMSSRGTLAYAGISLADIAEVHRAIVRVERAITDEILSIGVSRDVVPMPPLGLYKGLTNPYAPPESVDSMDKHWQDLSAERETWTNGILEELVL